MEECSRLFLRVSLNASEQDLILDRGLVIEKGASLEIIAENPLGEFDYDYISNTAKLNTRSASRVQLSRPLRIKAGVNARFVIKAGGILIIKSEELTENINITVGPGQKTDV